MHNRAKVRSRLGEQSIQNFTRVRSLPADTHESLASNAARTLQIKLLNHSPQFLFLETGLTQLARHAPQIFQIDIALSALVEEFECAQDLIARIPLQDLERRNGLEGREGHEQVRGVLGVCDGALIRRGLATRLLLLDLRTGHTIGRKKGDQLLFTEREAEGPERNTELMVIEVAIAVEIKKGKL